MTGESSKEFNSKSEIASDTPLENHSDSEVRNALQNYQKLAEPGGRDEKFMKEIEDKYLNAVSDHNTNTAVQGVNFEAGLRSGIHQEQNRAAVQENLSRSIQDVRNSIATEAKEHYHVNYSLSKSFNEEPTPSINMDKE